MKNYWKFLLAIVLLLVLIPVQPVRSAAASPYDLIAAVNELRQNQDLNPLEVDNSLMAAAQGQADYLASISPNVGDGHEGPGGSRPADRAAAAGYPLGPGWNVVENWAAGTSDTSISEIIYQSWSDALHWNTMTTVDGVHMGAGVAEAADGMVYYILDVGVQYGSGGSGSGGVGSTVPTTAVTAQVAPVKVSTPNADGSVVHVVDTGQALWSIAAAYEVTVDELRALNDLPENAVIYVEQELLIRVAYTPTPSPTTTVTPRPPTRTPIPPQTAQSIITQTAQAEEGASGFLNMDRSTMGLVLVLISGVGLALMIISFAGRDKTKKEDGDDA